MPDGAFPPPLFLRSIGPNVERSSTDFGTNAVRSRLGGDFWAQSGANEGRDAKFLLLLRPKSIC